MRDQNLQLNDIMQISSGHILYFYENDEAYLENAASFVLTGLEQGHHLMLIEHKQHLAKLQEMLQKRTSPDRLGRVHFFDSHCFYGAHDDFHVDAILRYSSELLQSYKEENITIRTWAHVEWKDPDEILPKLSQLECASNHTVDNFGLVSVCAYNGKRVSTSFFYEMLKHHEYFMTDTEIQKSSFFRKTAVAFPSLSIQAEQKRMYEQDKHKHHETKRKLRATAYQLESFITRNLDPVLIFNEEYRVIRANTSFEKLFGWTSEEITGLSVEELPTIPPERKREVEQNRRESQTGKYIQEYETIRLTRAGMECNVRLSIFPLRNERDQISGWVVIIRDVTEERQAQELLLRTEKLSVVSELAAGIAHEIRNPLTSVKGFLQLVKSQTEAAENRIYFDIMLSEIDRIDMILGELLMLAKPQVTHFQRKNIGLMIREVVTLLEAQANMCNVQIVTRSVRDDIYINCEEYQLKQVCINFIKNAIEAMPNGGQLKIDTDRDGENVIIRFTDQGVGIPKHVLDKLGQPFYTTKEKGTGLGFMVSKKIIENHDGMVQVSSEINKGTTIEIRLAAC